MLKHNGTDAAARIHRGCSHHAGPGLFWLRLWEIDLFGPRSENTTWKVALALIGQLRGFREDTVWNEEQCRSIRGGILALE